MSLDRFPKLVRKNGTEALANRFEYKHGDSPEDIVRRNNENQNPKKRCQQMK
jgi:hypothetical protein